MRELEQGQQPKLIGDNGGIPDPNPPSDKYPQATQRPHGAFSGKRPIVSPSGIRNQETE